MDAVIPVRRTKTKVSSWKKIRKSWQLYVLFMLPLLYIIVFKYVPIYGAIIAFKNFIPVKGIWGSEWVGLDQFTRFIQSYDFMRLMKNTLSLSVYSLVAEVPFPILLALSLNYVNQRHFKKTVQMVTYAPHFISVVVMVGIILQILDPRTGLVHLFTEALGLKPVNLMGEPELFQSIFVWSHVWQHVGFACIVYLAALASIDPALHEAAVVDGATKLRRMWHIDLPGIMPIAIILLILSTGRIMDVGFEKVLLMQNPLNMRTSEIIDTYVYKVGLASPALNFSYASAIGLFKSVINLILLISVNKIAKKVSSSSLW